MGCSAKVALRRPPHEDSTYQVRLLVVLDGPTVPIGLNVPWQTTSFNEETGSAWRRYRLKSTARTMPST
jgi:hypothetical protein